MLLVCTLLSILVQSNNLNESQLIKQFDCNCSEFVINMENTPKVLDKVIEQLEQVYCNLLVIKKEIVLANHIQVKNSKSRFYMKSILDSLVKKTTDGCNLHDDISMNYSETNTTISQQPLFKNLISSDEYLMKIKHLLVLNPNPENVYEHILTLQELLEDLLYSICQINTNQMKLPSGILVKDLIKLRNLYIYIGEAINAESDMENVTNTNSSNTQVETQLTGFLQVLQLCLKEMSKVKFNIEHYFKFNILEIQFKESGSMPNKESTMGNVQVLETPQRNQSKYFTNAMMNENYSQANNKLNINTRGKDELKNCEYFIDHTFDKEIHNSPLNMFPTIPNLQNAEVNNTNSNILNQKPTGWKNWCDYNQAEKVSCDNFFNQLYMFPPECIIFDPTTMFIQSKIKETHKQSLPKVYSIDSVLEATENSNTSTSNKEIEIDKINTYFGSSDLKKEKENHLENNLPINNPDDLFGTNENTTQCDDLKSKISSLFDMLRTNQILDNENIFDVPPLKTEHFECLDCKPNEFNSTKNQKHNLVNIDFNSNDSDTKSTNHFQKKILGTQIQFRNGTNTCLKECEISKIENSNKLLKTKDHMKYPKQFTPSNEYDVIYDDNSIIELFRTTKTDHGTDSEFYQHEETSTCMWPVAAKYIKVSKNKGQGCHSISSGNSISLAKSFEKSFFSLHLNKRYEQNHLYDGDLIVLERPKEFGNQGISSNSMLNQSYFIYDVNQCETNKASQAVNHNNKNDTQDKKNKIASQSISTKTQKRIIQKDKKALCGQKTMTVQYADCQDSFVLRSNYKRENLGFLNIDKCDVTNNWNSFISIFTSKIGPTTTRVNHHRMFRKVIRNIAADSYPSKNLLTNVHTLTSSSGPFRLFDVNGYPLTDSTGNVLKDPYGKSVVLLDSTGFPVNDIKVFDAAGNTPKDINFDPTQKPKANSIVIKLTDNFRRPLHLFDKYGRPLTDAGGKLLVNIHGRPLLRFDNFGRPNTDYRGGPLYTDNGTRWFYKTDESLFEDKIITDKAVAYKEHGSSENDFIEDSCELGDTVESHSIEHEFNNSEDLNLHKTHLRKTKSDIWGKVESVLQLFPKKKLVDQKVSQVSVIVNNVSIKQKSLENDFLKSIIYHNNSIQQDIDHKNNNTLQAGYGDYKLQYQDEKSSCEPKFFLRMPKKHLARGIFTENRPFGKLQFPLYKNILIDKTCSKCFAYKKMHGINRQNENLLPNNILLAQNNEHVHQCMQTGERDLMLTNCLVNSSNCQKTNKNISSTFTFENQSYLNNLCNQILKNRIDSKDIEKFPLNANQNKTRNWTDTSITGFTSSVLSKYTSDFMNYTESPNFSSDYPQNCYSKIKKPKEHECSFKKYSDHECMQKNQYFIDDETSSTANITKYTKYKGELMQMKLKNKQSTSESTQENIFFNNSTSPVSSKKHLNNKDIDYQANVKKIFLKNRENNKFNYDPEEHFQSTDSTYDLDNKKHNYSNVEKEHIIINQPYSLNNLSDTNDKNPYTDEKIDRDVVKDSPFRFPSKQKNEITAVLCDEDITKGYTTEKNTDFDYGSLQKHYTISKKENRQLESGDCKSQNVSKYHNYDHTVTELNINKQLIKNRLNHKKEKPGPSNKECNLVSFFGSPVKYVLNKFDSKKTQKIHATNKSNTFPKAINGSRANKHNNPALHMYQKNKLKHFNEPKLKTLYQIHSSKQKLTSSSNEKIDTNKVKEKPLYVKQRGKLIPFRSKSCTEIVDGNYIWHENRSQKKNVENKYSEFPKKDLDPLKCPSDTIVTDRSKKKHNHSMRRGKNHEVRKEKPKNEQYSMKTTCTKKKHNIQQSNDKNEKQFRKQSTRNDSTSYLMSPKNKTEDGSPKKLEEKQKHIIK